MATSQKRLLLGIAALLALLTLVLLFKYVGFVTGQGRFAGDFMSFWKAADRVYAGDVAGIYAPAHWRGVMASGKLENLSWFVYPPYALFGLWPLGSFSFTTAALLWLLAPVPVCAALAILLLRRSQRSESEASRLDPASFSLVAAVSLAVALPLLGFHVVAAQSGAIMAVLFLGVALCWLDRPILAGVLIGVMSIKPQMGVLIPIALIAAGRWQTIAAATATIAVMITAVTLWLGGGIWYDYLAMTQLFAEFVAGGHQGVTHLAVAPYVSLLAIGTPRMLALVIAGICSLSAVAVVFHVFRAKPRDGRDDLRFAILVTATLMATPYALSYDMPILIAALVPFIVRVWNGRSEAIELAALVAVVAAPVGQLLAVPFGIPFGFLALAVWFAVLLHRYRAEGSQTAHAGAEPAFPRAISPQANAA